MVSGRQAPPTVIPLRFILFGVACILAASFWLILEPGTIAGPYYRPHTVALAHLVVLGCAMSVCLGAMYQLVPVALEVSLFSPRMASAHTAFHLLGVSAMVPAFFAWEMRGVALGGTLVFCGVLMFVHNMVRTLGKLARFDITAAFVTTTLGWMLATTGLGLTMVTAKFRPLLPGDPMGWLQAHAHLGILGIFINLIIGISLKLVPMFTLAEWREGRRAWWLWGLVNGGLAVLVISLPLGWNLGAGLAAVAIAMGLSLHAIELVAILRIRRRAEIDWGLITFLGGVAMLLPTCALGIAAVRLGGGQLGQSFQLAYPFAALFGVVVPSIVGMLYKILPFLVWHRVYGPRVGREPVPVFADMVSPILQSAAATLLLVGFLLLVAGIFGTETAPVIGGAVVWLCGMLCFAGNVALVMRHWFVGANRPTTEESGRSV
ncbi:MAG TPA: hypothetical protein PLU30_05900 [Verrucomicrobiae bacterium]|nr:hypothetical protein [Verrucomicrobiae bacterium]